MISASRVLKVQKSVFKYAKISLFIRSDRLMMIDDYYERRIGLDANQMKRIDC